MAATEEKIKEYMKMNQTIILATIDSDGVPDIRTLGGYGLSDYVIYFSTLKTSNKVKQLEEKKMWQFLYSTKISLYPNSLM